MRDRLDTVVERGASSRLALKVNASVAVARAYPSSSISIFFCFPFYGALKLRLEFMIGRCSPFRFHNSFMFFLHEWIGRATVADGALVVLVPFLLFLTQLKCLCKCALSYLKLSERPPVIEGKSRKSYATHLHRWESWAFRRFHHNTC